MSSRMRERQGRTRDEEIEGGGNGFLVSVCFGGVGNKKVAGGHNLREREEAYER